MTKNNPTIIPPEGGWKEHTFYIVEVCFNQDNPCFGAIFYTGFLNGHEGEPGGYNHIFCGGIDPEEKPSIREVVFMRAIRKLTDNEELDGVENRYKLPHNHTTDPFDLKPQAAEITQRPEGWPFKNQQGKSDAETT